METTRRREAGRWQQPLLVGNTPLQPNMPVELISTQMTIILLERLGAILLGLKMNPAVPIVTIMAILSPLHMALQGQ